MGSQLTYSAIVKYVNGAASPGKTLLLEVNVEQRLFTICSPPSKHMT